MRPLVCVAALLLLAQGSILVAASSFKTNTQGLLDIRLIQKRDAASELVPAAPAVPAAPPPMPGFAPGSASGFAPAQAGASASAAVAAGVAAPNSPPALNSQPPWTYDSLFNAISNNNTVDWAALNSTASPSMERRSTDAAAEATNESSSRRSNSDVDLPPEDPAQTKRISSYPHVQPPTQSYEKKYENPFFAGVITRENQSSESVTPAAAQQAVQQPSQQAAQASAHASAQQPAQQQPAQQQPAQQPAPAERRSSVQPPPDANTPEARFQYFSSPSPAPAPVQPVRFTGSPMQATHSAAPPAAQPPPPFPFNYPPSPFFPMPPVPFQFPAPYMPQFPPQFPFGMPFPYGNYPTNMFPQPPQQHFAQPPQQQFAQPPQQQFAQPPQQHFAQPPQQHFMHNQQFRMHQQSNAMPPPAAFNPPYQMPPMWRNVDAATASGAGRGCAENPLRCALRNARASGEEQRGRAFDFRHVPAPARHGGAAAAVARPPVAINPDNLGVDLLQSRGRRTLLAKKQLKHDIVRGKLRYLFS